MLGTRTIAALLLMASPALAAGPEDPVKSIMDLATKLWSDSGAEGQDYFDKQRLDTLYSKAFVSAYQQAAKFPIYDEAGGPFGYDIVTNSQDGCPLKDLAIVNQGEKAGVTDIKVTFKLYTCFDDDPTYKDGVSEVHFDVIMENGQPVIADIHRVIEGKADSLITEMQDIAKNGGAAPDDAPTDPEQK
ncbi:hypothetical protein JJB09_05050 [Rhizobium sp. KVB221]|uniref:DUF3828 domain-containing protein n=1 Tax=Rhizobium setariae TaxID=2801340 RepID=A0A936YKS1_9HYPH|nr:hypothetical protein [Rhizobium setariae]MBL0371388.1 hypothetical protein [Rhizobium setariae]